MRFQVVCSARGCYLSDLGAFYDKVETAEFLAFVHEERNPNDFGDGIGTHVVTVKDLKAVPTSRASEPAESATGKKEAAHG